MNANDLGDSGSEGGKIIVVGHWKSGGITAPRWMTEIFLLTFQPVFPLDALAGDRHSEHAHAEQTHRAYEHRTQVHIWNTHTHTHTRKKKISSLVVKWSYLHAHHFLWDEIMLGGDVYGTEQRPVRSSSPPPAQTFTTKNMLPHLQTSSRGCLWPRWPGERELQGEGGLKKKRESEREREVKGEVDSLTCCLPDYSLAEG